LHVDWSKEEEAVVVYYYGAPVAEHGDITEEDMMSALALEEPEYYDCVERSSLAEIRKWVKDGRLTELHEALTEHDEAPTEHGEAGPGSKDGSGD